MLRSKEFVVRKKTSPDTLTLKGDWQINKRQQITYTYEKFNLITKEKISNTLTFEGFWEINRANRLTYILSRSLNSGFDFRVQIESPNVYPQQGVIKYRLGIGLKEGRPAKEKIISLYGTWKFNRRAGLIFQMDYGQGQIRSIDFGADVNLTHKDKVIFSLTNKKEEPLGMRLTFTHRFLNKLDAETFLRINKMRQEGGIEMGMRIPF